MKILLLEDEHMLLTSIAEFLNNIGHSVECFYDGADAFKMIEKEQFDLMILDINVPSINGFELLEKMRSIGTYTPVIFISALVDIKEITKGFTLGCSDYIKKPFHLKELELRIDNISKLGVAKSKNHLILSRNYSFDKNRKELLFNGEIVELTKRQIEIIELLAKNAPSIVDFDRFRDEIWQDDPIDNASIRAEVARFRKLLKEDFIKNIRGLGYKIEKCNI